MAGPQSVRGEVRGGDGPVRVWMLFLFSVPLGIVNLEDAGLIYISENHCL